MNTTKQQNFIFTPDNLLDNLDKLGAWSSYGLACEAFEYYFPEYKEKRDKNKDDIYFELKLLERLRCNNWQCAIIKYHKEIGYKNFREGMVNEY